MYIYKNDEKVNRTKASGAKRYYTCHMTSNKRATPAFSRTTRFPLGKWNNPNPFFTLLVCCPRFFLLPDLFFLFFFSLYTGVYIDRSFMDIYRKDMVYRKWMNDWTMKTWRFLFQRKYLFENVLGRCANNRKINFEGLIKFIRNLMYNFYLK